MCPAPHWSCMDGNLHETYHKKVDFYKVFKGFWGNDKFLMEMIRSSSREHMPPTEFQWPHLRNARFPTVFERCPCGIQLHRHCPLRTGAGFSWELIIKMLIFTRFLKGFGEMISFHDNDKFLPLGGTRRNTRFPLFSEVPGGVLLACVQYVF